ncbi:MAG: HlyD family efflux transporter periplasmic adaptor subunit [Bradymonadales bacterium]|nr:HlyD family efflux transporter periplasmic adaptor subunit [Bradymonadales bacterium]
MRRFIAILVIISAILSIILYRELKKQRLEAEGPAGGSATIEGIEVDVVSRLAARLTEVMVEEGDRVEAGQVVALLDCREQEAMLAEAEAAVRAATAARDAAQAQVELATIGVESAVRQTRAAEAAVQAAGAQRSSLQAQRDAALRAAERLATLQAAGGASEQELDSLQTQASVLAEQIQALRTGVRASQAQANAVSTGEEAAAVQLQLAQTRTVAATSDLERVQAGLDRLRTVMEECRLVAPRSGYVQTRSHEPGELLSPGSRLLTIVDTSIVRATFYLPNAELAAARPGLPVELVADAYPERTFHGTIRKVSTSAEFTPRNVQTRQDRDRLVYAVEVQVENPDNTLRPGMPVQVAITGSEPVEPTHSAQDDGDSPSESRLPTEPGQ